MMSCFIKFVPLNVSRYECSVNKVNYVSVSQELLSCSQLLIICDDLQYEKKMNCSLWCQQQARAWWSAENRLTTTWQEPWTIDWNLLGLWWWGEIIYCYYTSVQVNNNSPVNTKYLVIRVYWLGYSLTWYLKKW